MKSIEKKAMEVEGRVNKLRELSIKMKSLHSYQKATYLKDAVERNMQVAIEACLDIGKIIISKEGLREPEDNKGVFIVLTEADIISSESLEFMVPMAGTRNVLVHGYDRINDSTIYTVIKKRLDDFTKFLREVRDNYIKKDRA